LIIFDAANMFSQHISYYGIVGAVSFKILLRRFTVKNALYSQITLYGGASLSRGTAVDTVRLEYNLGASKFQK